MERAMLGLGSRMGTGELARKAETNVKGTSLSANKLLGLSLLAVAAGRVSCGQNNGQAGGGAAFPPPLVTVVQATAQDVPRYLDEIGRNIAFESVNVTPQAGGQVIERHFQDGENLRKG